MTVTDNQRPGVYSVYTVDSSYSTPRSRQYAALVMSGNPSMSGTVHAWGDYDSARIALENGGDSAVNKKLLTCVRILLESGVAKVLASVKAGNLAEALEPLLAEDDIGAVVCEAKTEAEIAALKSHLTACGEARRERIAYIGGDTSSKAASMAELANSERIAVCCPASGLEEGEADAIFSAAAMAGAVLSLNDPAYSFNNLELEDLAVCDKLTEAEIQSLISGGVTVLEGRGGTVRCVRAVTTKTKTAGIPDKSMRSLNTILIIDDVIKAVRSALEAKLSGHRITMDSVRAQVVVELAAKQDDGLIGEFDAPRVYQDSEDPSVCVVELRFAVAHVPGQIHIKAHVRV